MTEPSINDLSPIVPPGIEKEPMLLLDTTGSMAYHVSADSTVQRRQLVGEAMGTLVTLLSAADSQAAGEHERGEDAGGLMTITFADGRGECIGDLSPENWRAKWEAIRWGGDTRIMPGWDELLQTYVDEFSGRKPEDRPAILALVLTDGEAADTDQFVAALTKMRLSTYAVIALFGYGPDHDRAVAAYEQVAKENDHVRVVRFTGETDPVTIAQSLLSIMG